MKRAASPLLGPPAKRRPNPYHGIFNDKSAQKSFESAALNPKEPGYISGVIKTLSDTNETREIYIYSQEDAGIARVRVTGSAFKRLQDMDVKLRGSDTIALALRGARVLETNASSLYRLKIEYSDGIMLKLLRHAGPTPSEASVVDTWKAREMDWYSAEDSPRVSQRKTVQPISPDLTSPLKRPPDSDIEAQSSKGKKRQKKGERAQQHKKQKRPTTPSSSTREPAQEPHQAPTPQSNIRPSAPPLRQNAALDDVPPAPLASTPSRSHSAPKTAGGVPPNPYDSLQTLQRAVKGLYNVVAVVHSVNAPPKKLNRDWTCTLHIYDPSICPSLDLDNPKTYTVVCFTAKCKEWLPYPEPGDIVILRNLKISNRSPAVGYKDRLVWAVYKPVTGIFQHDKSIPTEEMTDMRLYRPFHEPVAAEIEYCQWLLEWKKSRHTDKDVGRVYQVPRRSFESSRKDRLICDAQPDSETKGFFNAIVVVLDTWSDGRTFVLFVTDYTCNQGVHPITSSFWPSSLDGRVLRIECWDDAYVAATTVIIGDIYELKNVRMKVNGMGTLEGKMNDAKIRRLSRDDTDGNPSLKKFLIREKMHKEESEAREHVQKTKLEYKNIGDAAQGVKFDCVAEVLDFSGDDQTLIVTDFTKHDLLLRAKDDFLVKTVMYQKEYLEGRVLPIRLQNQEHVKDAKDVAHEPGSLCVINGVKIVVNANGQVRGYLDSKSDKCVINRVLEDSTTHERDIRLMRDRKAKLIGKQKDKQHKPDHREQSRETKGKTARQTVVASEPEPSTSAIPSTISSPYKDYKKANVKALRDKPSPGDYRLTAHLVNYPNARDLSVVASCSNCKKDIPLDRRACLACNDTEHEHVRHHYRWLFQLGHEGEEQLAVCADDACPLFDGLKRVDLREDEEALQAFNDRIAPIIGPDSEAPTLTFFIKSRLNVKGQTNHFLQGVRAATT